MLPVIDTGALGEGGIAVVVGALCNFAVVGILSCDACKCSCGDHVTAVAYGPDKVLDASGAAVISMLVVATDVHLMVIQEVSPKEEEYFNVDERGAPN